MGCRARNLCAHFRDFDVPPPKNHYPIGLDFVRLGIRRYSVIKRRYYLEYLIRADETLF